MLRVLLYENTGGVTACMFMLIARLTLKIPRATSGHERLLAAHFILFMLLARSTLKTPRVLNTLGETQGVAAQLTGVRVWPSSTIYAPSWRP